MRFIMCHKCEDVHENEPGACPFGPKPAKKVSAFGSYDPIRGRVWDEFDDEYDGDWDD